jgi:hypothetical protein
MMSGMGTIRTILQRMYGREPPTNTAVWHEWNILGWPVRDLEGRLTYGAVWRRRTSLGWEYKIREETDEDRDNRQAY